MSWNFSMETVLDLVGAKTRGKVTRAGEIEVQCPHGVCGHKKQPIYFSVNLAKGQYNCFHCCSGCPYSGGMIDLYCMFTGLDPNNKKEVKKAFAQALDGTVVKVRETTVTKRELAPVLEAKPDEELDKVYRAVLNELTLKPEHRENLKKRGLSDEMIDKCLYRSMPERWSSVFAALKKKGISFKGVPGFYEKNGKAFAACSKPGFFIPYFNSRNEIVGMQCKEHCKLRDSFGNAEMRWNQNGLYHGRRVKGAYRLCFEW